MFQENLFKDKVILVTGGRSGIGYAIAEQYLRLGARVFIASRKEEKLIPATEALNQIGPTEYFVCDIRETDQIMNAVVVDRQPLRFLAKHQHNVTRSSVVGNHRKVIPSIVSPPQAIINR